MSWHLILTYVATMASLRCSDGIHVLRPGYYIMQEKRDEQGTSIDWSIQSNSLPTLEAANAAFDNFL